MTSRDAEIKHWLTNSIPYTNTQPVIHDLKYIQADASSRKYLRLTTDQTSYIIMDSPPDPNLVNFISIAQIMRQHGINTPEIIASDIPKGLILMNDFGSQTYLQAIQNNLSCADSLYRAALQTLIKIQVIQPSTSGYTFQVMGPEYIADRLAVFKTWYLQQHLGLVLTDKIESLINKMLLLFTNNFNAQAQTVVHVDYHSRNLMAIETNNPGVLDFQDAMLGPITYDLVSLLQDAYIYWPRNKVEQWVSNYLELASAANVLVNPSLELTLRDFDLVGLQRHIKNLGIFARLHHRDNKSNYLNDIPMLLKYIEETCTRYADLNELGEFIQSCAEHATTMEF